MGPVKLARRPTENSNRPWSQWPRDDVSSKPGNAGQAHGSLRARHFGRLIEAWIGLMYANMPSSGRRCLSKLMSGLLSAPLHDLETIATMSDDPLISLPVRQADPFPASPGRYGHPSANPSGSATAGDVVALRWIAVWRRNNRAVVEVTFRQKPETNGSPQPSCRGQNYNFWNSATVVRNARLTASRIGISRTDADMISTPHRRS